MWNSRTDNILQLIAAGSSKLASVPSGGAGGAPAAGGAAAGGAAAAEEKAEEKEEGTSAYHHMRFCVDRADNLNREGGVRRRHGIRSLRLSASYHLLRQRRYTTLGNWHKNGLHSPCMVSGVEGFALDSSRWIQNKIRYPEAIVQLYSFPTPSYSTKSHPCESFRLEVCSKHDLAKTRAIVFKRIKIDNL